MSNDLKALFSIEPLSPAIGAVLRGLDLSRPQSDETIFRIKEALVRNHVLFFENQDLTPAQQRDFAARFGALHEHPLHPPVEGVPEIVVLDSGPGSSSIGDHWHTDVTFIQSPPMGAVLAAKELPATGGDTSWSSCIAAFEALSPAWQNFLIPLHAVHDFAKAFPLDFFETSEEQERWQRAREKNPPVTHPVVRTHPDTQRKGLFVNEGFTSSIVGLSERESRAVLNFVFEHAARPEFTVRWRWKRGDVAFWDSRCTQHYQQSDHLPHRRTMHRATILGDRPQ